MTVKFPNYTISSDAILEIQGTIGKYGDNVLVVGGKTALEKTKTKLVKALNESPLKRFEFMWYGGECTQKNIDKISRRIRDEGFNLVLGVGGGKALDTSKAAAEEAGVPVLTVPTIAATCAAVTSLSIVFTDHGIHERNVCLENTPVHIFIDMQTISESPCQYLWAGMGDTIAKYYEVNLNVRNKTLDHAKSMARQISFLCQEPIFRHGVGALTGCEEQDGHSQALMEMVLNNIISTGMVSLLVGDENNASVAHGVCHGLSTLKDIKKNRLHGELVAYGVLILLMVDGNEEEIKRLYPLYKEIGWPTCLEQLNLPIDETRLGPALDGAADNFEMKKAPFDITRDMIWRAVKRLENFNSRH